MMQPNDTGTVLDIAIERLQSANQYVKDARALSILKSYNSAINRIYYAVFKAISAVHALDKNSYRKHKEAIGLFNKNYVNAGLFPHEFGRQIHKLEKMRHSSDYDDFYRATKDDVAKGLVFANEIITQVKHYCERQIGKPINLQEHDVNVNTR